MTLEDMEIRHSGLSQNLKTSKLETLELNADQIIVHATVKEQARFIVEDRPEDNVSYEESPRFIDEDQPEDNVSYEESKTMEEHHRFEISCQNKFLGN